MSARIEQLKPLLTLLISAAVCACQQPPMSPIQADDGIRVPPMIDVDSGADMSPPRPDQEPPLGGLEDQGPVEPPPSISPAGWVELDISPARVFFTFGESPEVVATAYNIYGEEIEGAEVSFELTGAIGSLTVEGPLSASLSFTQDGEGSISACIGEGIGVGATGEPVCARRALLVDNAPPEIEVLWPPRGAQLAPYDAPSVALSIPAPDENEDWIPIVAEIRDGQRDLIVRLNGQRVSLQEGGRLEAYLPARLGYQEVDISVDDGVRFEVTRDRRWVLWADDYLPFEEEHVRLESGAQFSLNQRFLDQDQRLNLAQDSLVATELAQLIDLFLSLIDPTDLLPSSMISSGGGLSLSIGEVSLGDPEVDIYFTQDGISLYVELSALTLATTGSLNLGGEDMSLNGSLAVGLSIYGDFGLETRGPAQPLVLVARGSGVAITSVSADFVSPSAEALIEALDNEARQLVVESVEGTIQAIILDELPPLLEESVNSLFSTVNYIPFTLDSGIEGSPVLRLALEVSPERLTITRQERASLWCDITVQHRDGPPLGPGEGVNQRGVPLARAAVTPPELPSSFTLNLQQSMLSMILTEIWRGGLLSLSPPLPPEASALVSEVKLIAQSPPVIVQAELGDPYPMYLELGGLHLEMSGPFAPETDEFEIFARVGARLNVEGGSFTIELEESPEVISAVKVLRNPRPVISEEILSRVISSSVWPMLSAGITSQIRIGLEDAPLDLEAFNQLGINFESARMVPLFDPETTQRGGWMSLRGMIEARFER